MTDPQSGAGAPLTRDSIVAWLRRVNAQLSDWAASTSWWRLVLLFLLVTIAGSMLSDQLGLKHQRIQVPDPNRKPVELSIGGKDGIRITERGVRRNRAEAPPAPPAPPVPGASGPSAESPVDPASAAAAAKEAVKDAREARDDARDARDLAREAARPTRKIVIHDDDDDDEMPMMSKKVFTFRGFVGDVGATLMILLFAYLTAAKIVSRKVAQADEKVRTATDAAEREAMSRQLVQAQLQVLQAQVEPHFLFNTLAAVDYLIETDPARASQMQKKLITYLRGALPQMRQETSTLGRELRLIRSYLDLIKMRIEDRLDVEYAVPDFLEAAEFPPMMLQSLVENAIKHGIEPKPEGGKVTVAARIQKGMLWVEVKDTGVGIVDTERLESPTSGTGIGLQNIRDRLAMLYPGKGRLTLISDDTAGTTVKIGVPYLEREEAAGEEGKPAGGQEQAA